MLILVLPTPKLIFRKLIRIWHRERALYRILLEAKTSFMQAARVIMAVEARSLLEDSMME